MQIRTRSRVIVFILSFLVWVALTSLRDWQEVIAGLVVAALVSLLAGHFLVTTEKRRPLYRRVIPAILYLFRFLWEMVRANVHVAYLVLHPKLPIKPGIVKVQTRLTKDSAITVLTNSITLTPGTLTVDVDPETHMLYIHWIDVRTGEVEEASREIVGRFEKRLMEVFE